MFRNIVRSVLATATIGLSGCLLISPYSGQVIPSRTADVPFQAWTSKSGGVLSVECMPTNRFGPEVSPYGSWSQFATLPVSDDPSLDSRGAKMYSASRTLSLPESCWYPNRSNGRHYTSIRVNQSDYIGSESYSFLTLEGPGSGSDLECVGRETGRSGGWLGWLDAPCHNRNVSGDATRWVILVAEE